MGTPVANWKAVIDATVASRKADCGHTISRKSNALIWLRTEKAGGVREVYSVCFDCHVEGSDYEYQIDGAEPPKRERIEYL
jgi:hypothetical protein